MKSEKKSTEQKIDKKYKIGMMAALLCMVVWGFMPIYWQSLRPISSTVIIFYRIVLVGMVCFIIALKIYGISGIIAPIKSKKALAKFTLAGVLVTANWSIYIWAVNSNLVIQTCIGYYIEPLVVCVFGVGFFHEKLNKYKITALFMAGIGLLIVLIHLGEFPTVALVLAITFAIYAALKKSFQISPILSLLYETMLLFPAALVVIIYLEFKGKGAIGVGEPYQYGLLMLSGALTVLALGLFATAANKISLVSLGIMEYISPSIALILGIYLFREPFDLVQLISFAVIWIGLFVFTFGEIKLAQIAKRKAGEIIE